MADVEQQQGGPSSSRRRALTGKSKAQPANDWPRSREPRPRASPRSRRHGGDIDMDIVESSDADANDAQPSSARKHHHRRRPRLQPPNSTASDTASDTTAPARTPQRSPREKGRPSRSMRRPNVAASAVATAPASSNHWRPTFTVEEVDDDDDDDAAPSGPSRPVSRQTVSRRDTSSRSARRYRSTPESRRSPRTSVSDSDDDTEATSESDAERAVRPRGKHLPPIAPAVPPAPPAAASAIHNSIQERLSRPPEMVYEEDGDGTSRYAPSARHRSLSRPASSRRDHYRRPRDISVSGPPSLDETRSRSRSKSARPSRRHYESDVYVSSRPPSSFKRPNAASSYSLSSSKRSNIFGDLAATPVRPSHLDKPAERLTMCVSCRNDSVPVSTTVKLKCRHRMCHSCLRNSFKASLADPQHMPPRCCTTDSIPMRYMDNLFDTSFKREWNQKYMEHANRSRLLCASRRCGELIKPEDMRPEGNRWVGRCSRCRIKTCGSCGGKWHHQHDCLRDGDATRREPWQRCYRCKAVVEIKDSRNRMICHCGAESCSACGGKWKTCECPWFQYDPLEADTMKSRSNPFVSRPGSPRDLRSDFGPVTAAAARQRPSSYEEDPYLRRLNEQRDEHLARRMQSFDAFGHHDNPADFDQRHYELADTHDPRARRRRTEPRGDYGDPMGEDDYHRRAATVVAAPSPPQPHVPAAPPPPHSSFDPPSRPAFDRSMSGFDYAPPAHRDRGMRYASPERYDDYVPDMYTPDRRRARSPDEWHHQLSQERQPRPRDRRNTFPTESRPASPDTWQQLPTRYPSPERAMPTPEERRRAPSPERRRTSSLERRLAGRFKAESRQSPAAPTAPVGAVAPVGPGGTLGPLTPTRAQPAPSRAATHVGVPMPMAPAPPPAIHGASPAVASLRRHHTMDEDVYPPPGGMHTGGGIPPPADWFGPPPGHPHPHPHPHSHPHPIPHAHPHAIPHPHAHPHAHAHAHPHSHPPPGVGMLHPMHVDNSPNNPNTNILMDGSPRAPHVRRRPPPNQTLAQGPMQAQQAQVLREHSKFDAAAVQPRLSSAAVLAGLGGPGRGMHRVSEWVNHVEVGMPPEEVLVAGVH